MKISAISFLRPHELEDKWCAPFVFELVEGCFLGGGYSIFVTNFRINMLYYTKQYRFNVRKMENIR